MASHSLLTVPPKSTKSVDFQEKIPRFIAQNYDEEQPSKYHEAIKELNGLRDACVVKTPDRHETGLDLMLRCGISFSPSILLPLFKRKRGRGFVTVSLHITNTMFSLSFLPSLSSSIKPGIMTS